MSDMAELEPEDRRAGPGRREEDLTVAEHFDRFDREGFAITKAGILEALDVTKTSVDVLSGAIDKLASKGDLEEVRVETTNKTRRLWIVVLLVALAMAAGLGLFAELLSIAAQNRANGELLVECTTPSDDRAADPHECYELGEQARGSFTATLSEINSRLARIEAELQEDR